MTCVLQFGPLLHGKVFLAGYSSCTLWPRPVTDGCLFPPSCAVDKLQLLDRGYAHGFRAGSGRPLLHLFLSCSSRPHADPYVTRHHRGGQCSARGSGGTLLGWPLRLLRLMPAPSRRLRVFPAQA
jgi:hypothetical protein